jgi:hypothetical protein
MSSWTFNANNLKLNQNISKLYLSKSLAATDLPAMTVSLLMYTGSRELFKEA